jgi:hypothetical protein
MRYYGVISSDKLATQSSPLLLRMVARKPSLDWIREVLADPADCGGRARPASQGFVWRPAVVESVDLQSINNRPERPEGDDRLFCPSWQLMRLTAARKS